MPNPTTEFFAELRRRGHEPLLERMNTAVRFDLSGDGDGGGGGGGDGDGDDRRPWRLGIRWGDLTVSRGGEEAECVVTASRPTFDRIIRGETKPLAAWLRNEIAVEGRLRPLILLARLLPGPPGAHDPRKVAVDLIGAGQRRRSR